MVNKYFFARWTKENVLAQECVCVFNREVEESAFVFPAENS